MAPDLKAHLESLAAWHSSRALSMLDVSGVQATFHASAAIDIRSSVTACEDAERNAVIRDKQQAERRFAAVPAVHSAFASL